MSDILTHTRREKSPAPISITQVAKEIKNAGGSVWLLSKSDWGFLIRSEIGKKQLRVVLRPVNGEAAESIPTEPNPLHIVSDLPSLRAFLQSLLA